MATAQATDRVHLFHSGIAAACGHTGKIKELEAFLGSGDPRALDAPKPEELSSDPFLRHVLSGPATPDETVSVAMTPEGEYDIDAFFAG